MRYLVILLSVALFTPAVFASDQPEEVLSVSVDKPAIKFDNVIETVIIDTLRYQVPEPWAGNRLFPTSRNLDELKKIPEEYTHAGSEIYIFAEAYPAMLEMLEQARLDGVELKVESAYRSILYQTRIFVRMLEQGRTFDDIVRYVAPPGYSQHMLGTALDFYPSNWEFAETEQYRWLQENGAKFGFEETYSENNRYRMPWEAWHWNYIGEPDSDNPLVAEDADAEDEKSILAESAESTVTKASKIIERELEASDAVGSTFAEGAMEEEGQILSN
jgi:D-alanyl-D-alanine carboxypeptidase